jgi:hypothetical protein
MNELVDKLNLKISELENKQKETLYLLKEDLNDIVQKLSPIEIIKNVFENDPENERLGQTLIHNVIGITTGFISKKLMIGSTKNPMKRMLGSMIEFTIAKFVSNHSDRIQALGQVLLKRYTDKK